MKSIFQITVIVEFFALMVFAIVGVFTMSNDNEITMKVLPFLILQVSSYLVWKVLK